MADRFRFIVTDAAEAIVIHEALMSFRNSRAQWPGDILRREAADRLLARMDSAVADLAEVERRASEAPR